ncbi:hypothetical protein BSNK01_31180 [Bacillaceae bacterium]
MNQFDVSIVHRLADDLENVAKSIKDRANTPVELQDEITKINRILGSLQSHVQSTREGGTNPLIEENTVRLRE